MRAISLSLKDTKTWLLAAQFNNTQLNNQSQGSKMKKKQTLAKKTIKHLQKDIKEQRSGIKEDVKLMKSAKKIGK